MSTEYMHVGYKKQRQPGCKVTFSAPASLIAELKREYNALFPQKEMSFGDFCRALVVDGLQNLNNLTGER